ncbi:MAG: glycoside hydrolase family 3 N-terminal domain-containing protein [Spirochaetota bacterium]
MSSLPYQDSSLPIEERVSDLVSRMTIEEKTDQLIQIVMGLDENPNNAGQGSFRPTVGSILASKRGAAAHNEYQRIAVEETRLGIPIIWGYDVIHGCYTVYPVSLAQACSFNPELVEAAARVAAEEALAAGLNWTFAPMIDVCRDPRWGRIVEGYGEDPYLNGVFGAATVRGFQTDDLSKPEAIAACLKHFVGYGASEGGRDYTYTDVSRHALWESYLPPYEMGVRAGAATIMSSFNDISGTPAVVNRYALTEILRERWGFSGFVVSDWASLQQLGPQGFSNDPAVQTKAGLEAGNDMDMADQVFRNIPQLVESGRLAEAVVDEAVRRVLRVKFRLGLFENPYFEEKAFSESFLLPEYKETAYRLALESCVLLKNDAEILPLDARSIALIGPGADDPAAMLGNWECFGRPEDVVTLRAALEGRAAGTIRYAKGCEFGGDDRSGFGEALAAAQDSEVVVLCLGEESLWSGENHSSASIELEPIQLALLEELRAAGKPIVLVLTAGRPLGLHEVEPKVHAILAAWQLGVTAGTAIADLLLGRANPCGKLSVTFPRTTGHIPSYYCEHRRARPDQGLYRGIETSPLFEFGHGLCYTTFDYGAITLDATTVAADGTITASVAVTNTGSRDGKETVIWYVRDPEASITQPIRRVIAFDKVSLTAGETRTVTLVIRPDEHLSYPDSDGKRILEAGTFVVEASGRCEAEFVLEG